MNATQYLISGNKDLAIKEFLNGKKENVKMAVTIADVKRDGTKKGKMAGVEMAFLCVEDHTGTLDTATVFAEKWKEHKNGKRKRKWKTKIGFTP